LRRENLFANRERKRKRGVSVRWGKRGAKRKGAYTDRLIRGDSEKLRWKKDTGMIRERKSGDDFRSGLAVFDEQGIRGKGNVRGCGILRERWRVNARKKKGDLFFRKKAERRERSSIPKVLRKSPLFWSCVISLGAGRIVRKER